MNIMGGYIPKVRIERVSLSNGGKLIVEDNPHVVEKELERGNPLSERIEENFKDLGRAEQRAAFTAEFNLEVAKQSAIAAEFRTFLNAAGEDTSGITTIDFAEMFAIRDLLVEYGLKAYGREAPYLVFEAEPTHDRIKLKLIKNAEGTRGTNPHAFDDIFVGSNPAEGGQGGRLDNGIFGLRGSNGFSIRRPSGVRDKVRNWMDTLTQDRIWGHSQPPAQPLTLDVLFDKSYDVWSELGRRSAGATVPIIDDAVTAVLYVLTERAVNTLSALRQESQAYRAGAVISAQAVTAESSGQMSVELLLSVKSVVDSNGVYKSWLAKQDILDHLEFGIVEVTTLDAIEQARNSSISGRAMHDWLAIQEIGFNYFDPANFLEQDLRNIPEALVLTWPKLLPTMSLKTAIESNGMGSLSWQSVDALGNTVQEEATRNPQVDSDGNETETFTFRIQRTFPTAPSALAYYIIPYLNVPKFIDSLKVSIDFDEEIFREYREFFIGSMTQDLILKGGKIQGTRNVFSYMTSPVPPNRPQRRLWEGDVRYWTLDDDPPATGGYVGWKTVGLGDGTEVQQRELLVEAVPNNTIQDFRTIDRLEKTMTDLTSIDAKEFDPEIKGISNNQEIELVDSYFGDLTISRDINGIVSLFCPFGMESLVQRETLFSALWKNLNDDEKEELFRLIKFRHIRLKRRHVRDIATRNRMNGLSNDVPKIDEGDYEAPDTVLLDEGYPSGPIGTPITTDKASFRDLTMFARDPNRTFGKTKFFTFKDKTANKLNSGQHQYGIEFTIQDSSVLFFKRRRGTLSTQLSELKSYYNRMMVKNDIYDVRLDRIKPAAVENTPDLARYAPVFTAETSVFIRTLQILNTSDSPLDLPVVIQTIDTFLSPATATRDTVHRFMKVVQDVIGKLDSLVGISTTPPKVHSPLEEFRTPSSEKTTSKLITVEQYMANLYDATIAPGSGYYYMRPRFHAEPSDSPGMRQITSADIRQSQQIELNKSFPGTVNPQLLRDFSYYTPLYATILNTASSQSEPIRILAPRAAEGRLAVGRTSFMAFNVNGVSAHRDDVLNFLLHFWDTNAGSSGWYSTMEKYNLFVDMVRSLNLIKNSNQIAQGIDGHIQLPNEENQAASIASDAQRSKKTLLSLFSHQGVTLIDRALNRPQTQFQMGAAQGPGIAAPPVGGNGGFSPSIPTPAGGLNAAGQNVMGIGRDAPLNQPGLSDIGRDLPPATNRDPIQEYLRSLKSTIMSSPNAILRNVLQADDTTMGPIRFNKKAARAAYRQTIGDIVPTILPTSLKLLVKQVTPQSPIFVDVTATLNNEVRFANHGGIFDIHFNKVVELQVLEGFESPEQSSGAVLVDRPIWRKFEERDLETNSICRLIPYDNSGIGVAHPSYLEMPVFDHIFLVEGSGG
jgi:hypothetical protein